MSERLQLPKRINYVEGGKRAPGVLPIATGSIDKQRELASLGLNVRLVPGVKPQEIQPPNQTFEEVLEAKAKEAYILNGGPILVEDTSFGFDAMGGLPGPYTKGFLSTREQRANFVSMLPEDNRGATMKVGLAIYDGEQVQKIIGRTRGVVVPPRGSTEFAFDDIFITKTEIDDAQRESRQPRTYAEMDLDEKNLTSPRAKAVRKYQENPFEIGGDIFQMAEPSLAQLSLRRVEELPTSEAAVRFAFGLESLIGVEPNHEFKIDVEKYLKPLHKKVYGATPDNPDGIVWEFTPNPDSASQGMVIVPFIDLKQEPDPHRPGELKSLRLDVGEDGNPIFGQLGPKRLEMSLAARAREFMDMHSDDMHAYVRGLASGEIPHIPRSNKPSPVLEDMIGMVSQLDPQGSGDVVSSPAKEAIATMELGYKRQSHEDELSRTQAALKGTILRGPDGVPTSLFALGGMPPVTGSMDEVVTAAMSYMKSWIPHNGVFAGNFDRQLQLFEQSRDMIRSFELPKDIEDICIKQIGISVGTEKPEVVAEKIRQFKEAGGHAVRIYTTNPDRRIVDTAKAIREAAGEDFLICVGPVTDKKQATKLKKEAGVQMFLVGHGGGENCTSLSAGGAANSIELLYDLYQDKFFNDAHIGLEGGTGETIGALLPMLDVISLNRRGVGGIEPSQGIYVRKTGSRHRYVQPYHGSASAPTQIIEAVMDPEIARKRLGPDGKVRNVEGRPNYADIEDKIDSSVDRYAAARRGAGLAMADQHSLSLYELRTWVKENGHNHVEQTVSSSQIAGEHRVGV